jgi:hypothetical protein
MARLLRAMPELMVLIKGMVVAMRSVFFTLCLLAGMLYIFGIAFVQLMKDTDVGDDKYKNVPAAMNTLLLDGVLPDQSDIVETTGEEGWVFKVLILFYILLASLTILNMLVGVLCEVVSIVSAVEKESLQLNYVKQCLRNMLQNSDIDADGDECISKHEFVALLSLPDAAKAIQEVGVDAVGLMDFTDFIFKDKGALSFGEFMDTVLQLRGSNTATVKDLVDLRKHLRSELCKFADHTQDQITETFTPLLEKISTMNFEAGGPGKATLEPQQTEPMIWAASAASRLSAAANELTVAANEIGCRQRIRSQKVDVPGEVLAVEDS